MATNLPFNNPAHKKQIRCTLSEYKNASDRHHTQRQKGKEAGAACGSGILSKHLVLAPFSHNQAIVQFEMMEIAHPYLVLLHCKYTQAKFKMKLIRRKTTMQASPRRYQAGKS